MINSPLRYPGGKAKMYRFFSSFLEEAEIFGAHYCEPYAGGAGLALQLLSNGYVDQVSLNDIDLGVYSFWEACLNHTDEFCSKIEATDVSVEEWHKQKAIWLSQPKSYVDMGFATFFLNRTNRSGIIEGAGPIGGYKQNGNWKIDARYNKVRLISQIKSIAKYKESINLYNLDALDFIDVVADIDNAFVYLDPPYYVKGKKLYKNYYNHADHESIATKIQSYSDLRWIVSYDENESIREIYSKYDPVTYRLPYSAGSKTSGKEIIFVSENLKNYASYMMHSAKVHSSSWKSTPSTYLSSDSFGGP